MPKGILNLRYELAANIGRETGNETGANVGRLLKELNEVKANGFSLDMAVACWRWLRTREDFPIKEARIITVLKGSPVYVEQFKTWLQSRIPPVYEATEHDKFVLANGRMLRIVGFKYKVENWPHRLTTEQLIRCRYILPPEEDDIDGLPLDVKCLHCNERARYDGLSKEDNLRVVIYRCPNEHVSKALIDDVVQK